ncbi:hypothetical protein BASA50_004612 [Batrachochytrium salamandrivorans]|uniref:UspA domain-containing protein n=1 Tax=Batrachochytrium salamandrivorans TaxID=1357716 RepID=A0ABQ8FF64_9FUNG|nr:hypothetical protein BASA62_008757 [Batrachochytrium salamandrivorans]KAH6579312.1 hypothetical protein BASA61_010337 [Batrachochytrium salamandrivorans]KAH6597261.1 hypothetical protein BASA50_004612 [Batrachochytrium salamandrivorans]KAH9268174.1 hypothetical protein BASA84_000369 [Batrachochytrium salamandrivorans]KAJ1328717.1 hypothetical protein BSLG_009952 [Batrachochytrium salamandrivorans]
METHARETHARETHARVSLARVSLADTDGSEEALLLFEPPSPTDPQCARILNDHILASSSSPNHKDSIPLGCSIVCIDRFPDSETTFDWACHNLVSPPPVEHMSDSPPSEGLVLLHVVSPKELALFWKSTSPVWTSMGKSDAHSPIARHIDDSIRSEYTGKHEPTATDLKIALDQIASKLLSYYTARVIATQQSLNFPLRAVAILSNSPKDAICSTSSTAHPKCMVVGRKRAISFKSLTLGSTALHCLRHCKCTVVVVSLEKSH